MQELSLKNSNNCSLANIAASSQVGSTGQQVTLSYCNINDVPPSKEHVDIPDYNSLIELQNQLKREQMKLEERIRMQ